MPLKVKLYTATSSNATKGSNNRLHSFMPFLLQRMNYVCASSKYT